MGSSKAEDQFQNRLDGCRTVVKNSCMLRELREVLLPYLDSINKVRCLALGSFHEDLPARYQLALLLEIEELVSADKDGKILVSLYDPAFTAEDIEYISRRGSNWSVDERAPKDFQEVKSGRVLYFLPHAPLDLSEQVLITEEPGLFLANNIIAHTDRYTKARLHEKYPVLSKLLHVLDLKKEASGVKDEQAFSTFVSKRKKRKDRKVFKEPVIDYNSVESYFGKCTIVTDFQNGVLLRDQPWVNSFSDLAFHLIE